MKHIYFTVTNDLSYDQRMHRICHSLATNGFQVTLVGRSLKGSRSLELRSFAQKRLRCFFNKGVLFYAEYNLRLLFFLLFRRMDAVCAIDLDTILPCLAVSGIKRIRRVYDAHEYFTELKEVIRNPPVKKVWDAIESFAVPKFSLGYTVGEGLASEFRKKYGRDYRVIRNMPVLKPMNFDIPPERFIFYGGAVNEGRGFEQLIPAMQYVNCRLIIAGGGNYEEQLKALVCQNGLMDRVELKGWCTPEELRSLAQRATLGISLTESEGLNQYLSLPNKLFDYIHSGLPQITMNFPEYRKINDEFQVAVLVDKLSVESLVDAINSTLNNENLLGKLRENCLKARAILCWQKEEVKLIDFYNSIFRSSR